MCYFFIEELFDEFFFMSYHEYNECSFPSFYKTWHSSIGNVQATCREELKNPLVVDVKVVHDDASITKMHLEIFVEIKVSMETTLPYFIHMGF